VRGGGGGRVRATAEGSKTNALNKISCPQQFSDNLGYINYRKFNKLLRFFLKFVTAVWNGHFAHSIWVPKHVDTPQSSGNRPRYLSRYSDLLRAGWFGVQTPVEGRFSAPLQTDPEAHQNSCKMNTGSKISGVKRTGLSDDQPVPSSANVRNE